MERPDDLTLAAAIDLDHQVGALRLWYALDAASYADEGSWGS